MRSQICRRESLNKGAAQGAMSSMSVDTTDAASRSRRQLLPPLTFTAKPPEPPDGRAIRTVLKLPPPREQVLLRRLR